VFACFVRCDRDDPDKDWRTKPPARGLNVQNTNHGFDLKLDQKSTNVTSRLQFKFETRGFPRYRARYFSKQARNGPGNGGGGGGESSAFEFRVGLLRVVEFVDIGGDGLNAETAVRTLDFVGSDGKFSSLVASEFTVVDPVTSASVNGLSWTCFSPASATGATDEKLVIDISITESSVKDAMHNRSLAPNNLKFDLNLLNYNYSRNDTTVAFVFVIDSKAAQKHVVTSAAPADPEATEGEVDVGSGEGRLTYVKHVEVRRRNATAAVIQNLATGNADLLVGSILADDDHSGDGAGAADDDKQTGESRKMITFAVNGATSLTNVGTSQPSSIMWDPSVAVNDVLLDGAAGLVAFSPLLLIASMFLASFA
jgi:hypothetical protein